VARLAKVSVRTLHHYDEIGLLAPSGRSDAGYRLYDAGDLERLQQLLFFKELGFPLSDVRGIMLDPRFDRTAALHRQRALLTAKAERALALLDAVDAALEASEKGWTMDEKEMFEVFGEDNPAQYEDEARERWGDTEAYKESRRRAKGYTKEDWQRIKAEGEANLERMVALFDEGVSPDDPRAMDVAEEARLQIDQDFYPCSRQFHVNLGEMYIADPRFTAYYDKHREGLAAWFRDAIKANAARG
jgi:DNA-binding transcriptional MerR regulator